MVDIEVPEVDYTEYTNRQLAAVPLAVLAVALLVIAAWYVMTGTPVKLGMTFTGGTEIRVTTGDSLATVRDTFSGLPYDSITPVGTGDAYLLETQETDTAAYQQVAEAAGYDVPLVQTVSPTLGASAQQQALFGVGLAFVGMSVLVFVLFRSFIPSIAIVISAFSDIMIPVAIMNVFGIELSLGTVAALLMLIGYSVDSDILLNNHILRRRGGFYESAYRAMRTGVTMTLTSIVAMIIMTVVSTVLAIPLLPEIGLILFIGLTADLMNTYLMNMSLLRYYKFEGVNR